MFHKKLICLTSILAAVLFAKNVFAQSPQIDSLQLIIETSEDEAIKLSAYRSLCKLKSLYNPEEALEINSIYFDEAQKANRKDHMMHALGTEAIFNIQMMRMDSAYKRLQQAVEIAESDTADGMQIIHHYLGIYYTQNEEYEEAIEHFLLSLKMSHENGSNQNEIGVLESSLGFAYIRIMNAHEGINYCKSALKKLDPNSHFVLGITYSNLAEASITIRAPFDTVLLYQEKALEEALAIGDSSGYFLVLMNIVDNALDNDQFSIAEKYWPLATDMQKSMAIYPDLQRLYELTEANYFIHHNKADVALKNIKLILDIHKKDTIPGAWQQGLLNLMRKAYYAKGDIKNFYKYNEEYIAHQDSIFHANLAARISHYDKRYQTVQKEKLLLKQKSEIETIELEKEKQNAYIGGLSILVVLVSLLGGLTYNRQRLKVAKSKIEYDLARSEIQLIQLEKEKLQEELIHNQRELTAYTLSLARKNELLSQLKEKIETSHQSKDLGSVTSLIKTNIAQDSEWEEFNLRFKQVHPNFYSKVRELYPKLTPNDERICALLKLNLNSREISGLLGINVRSLDQSKYRIKKKMELTNEQDLQTVINHIDS